MVALDFREVAVIPVVEVATRVVAVAVDIPAGEADILEEAAANP